jgi:hypothetical protein
MTDELTDWRSPDGIKNALSLRSNYRRGFTAIAEFDRIGHLMLLRASNAITGDTVEELAGLAMVRRGVIARSQTGSRPMHRYSSLNTR